MRGPKPTELADIARITARQWRQYETRLNLSNPVLTGLRFLKVFENESVRTYAQAAGNAIEIIDVSKHQPRRIPSAKWRELIKRAWEADPLLCPKCSKEMRIVSLIDDSAVIKHILRHLGLWSACRDARGAGREQGVRVIAPARDPPEIVDRVIEPCYDDPFPDYDTEPVIMYANG